MQFIATWSEELSPESEVVPIWATLRFSSVQIESESCQTVSLRTGFSTSSKSGTSVGFYQVGRWRLRSPLSHFGILGCGLLQGCTGKEKLTAKDTKVSSSYSLVFLRVLSGYFLKHSEEILRFRRKQYRSCRELLPGDGARLAARFLAMKL